MKTAVLLVLLALAAPAQKPADAAHEEKVANIRKIMTLTGGDKLANQMFDQMAENMRAVGGADSAQYFAEFRKEFDLTKLVEMQVSAYDKYLSAEDVKGLVQFYESPTGKKMVEAMPLIMGEMMQEAISMSQEIAARIAKRKSEQK